MALVARYKLNADVLDTGSNGYHGTNNGVTFVTGKINNSASFDSVSDNISISTSSLNVSQGSISLWLNSDNAPDVASEFAYNHEKTGDRLWIYRLLSGGNLAIVLGTTTVLSIAITDSQWYHLVLTWNGSVANIYLDNVKIVTDIAYSGFTAVNPTATLGHGTQAWDGKLDEVRFYDHVLTINQIRGLYQMTGGGVALEITGVDYSHKLVDIRIKKSNNYFSGSFEVELFDPSNAIFDVIERFNEIKIYSSGVCKFTGVITNVLPSENDTGSLILSGLDYWVFALKQGVTRAFTNKTASEIIASIVSTELLGLNLSTADGTKFVATTNIVSNDATGTIMTYRGNRAIADLFEQLALDEDYVISIDENKDVVFRPTTAVDSGVTLNYLISGQIQSENIQKFGGDMVNVVSVRGAPGQPPSTPPVGAIVEDDALIAKYATATWDGKLPMITVSAPELATVEACEIRGEYELRKRNQDPDRGPVEIDLNLNIDVNQLVTLNIPHRGYNFQTFMVQSIEHRFIEDDTTIDVIYYTRSNEDLVKLIMDENRGTQVYLVDEDLIFTKFKKLREDITLIGDFDVESQILTGAEYGGFDYSTKFYGATSGAAEYVVQNQPMTINNKLIENWLRIIGQIATVPAIMSAANSYIAISDSSVAIGVADTTLTGEDYRKTMEAGYPNTATQGQTIWQSKLIDSDVVAATIRSIALFNHVSAGDFQLGGVLPAEISQPLKVADQDLIFTIRLNTDSSTGFLTSAGEDLLRDLLVGASTAYLDETNANIELITSPVYRNSMDTGKPDFTTVAKNTIKLQMTVDTGAPQTGDTFTGIDLYNLSSGGIQVIDGEIPIVTTIVEAQGLIMQILLKMEG